MLDKTFDPKIIEKKQADRWQALGVGQAKPASAAPPYTIMMPPPNVTGSLHIGHALNMTLQDVLSRFARMQGKDVLWQPGTDHAGIATQMVVERLLDSEGTSRHALGREKFLERVWDWKAQSGGRIKEQLDRMGMTPDWDRERFTMDEGLSKAVRKVFVQLYKEGLIYRDKRLVNWDPKLQTAISDLEVIPKEQKGHLWHIRYTIEGAQAETITVATTRPETLLGDTAVAVHPDDERYKHLIGLSVNVPIVNRLVPIIADDYADPEKGSGCVKITPAHDFNDFAVGKRHNLMMINLFDPQARMNENAPDGYQGLDRFEARKKILAELEEMDLIEKVEDTTHAVPYGDRSGVVIEPYLTDQWYCDAVTLAKPALAAVEQGRTQFVPKNWENTYFEWLRNIQPWCISRQLSWGHQIPAWYGPDGKVFVAETQDEAYKEADAFYGESISLTRDSDVLDTWFSSALWPFSTLGWPNETPELKKYYPGDVLVTGFDIIFFWVARMMMFGLHFMKDVPFRTVYIHALVRDASGQKMSKSKGNVMDPLTLTETYGADALRFTLAAMAAQGRDIKLSEDRIAGYRNFATKLWNAARYCQMNGCVPDERFDPASVNVTPNRWIVNEVYKTRADVAAALGAFKFNEAADALYHFAWGTFCDWYLEFTKSLSGDVETQKTTAWVLDQILHMLNPFMPYITEELFAALGQRAEGDMLCVKPWPTAAVQTNDAGAEMGWLIDLISEIRSVRMQMNVPAGAKIDVLVRGTDASTQARLKAHEEIILRMARLTKIETVDTVPQGAVQTVVGSAHYYLPMAGVIDLAKEKERLAKEVKKLESDLEKIERNLNNPQFVMNAPQDILEENKIRRTEAQGLVRKLGDALKQLSV
ncbi:MAG: valine--tRNA ligase [Alphaproteobacteria bacterium]|nr:valine--tRNA ligase [Alphaproteobacteria bacterium]